MWTTYIRSAEKRDDGNFYIIVDFVSDSEKRAKEYLINPTKTLEQFKSDLRSEIQSFNINPDILALKPGIIELDK